MPKANLEQDIISSWEHYTKSLNQEILPCIRRVDDLGRFIIPREIRKKLNIEESQPFEIYYNAKQGLILLKKLQIEEEEE